MWQATASLPEQVAEAAALQIQKLPDAHAISAIAAVGMGGSGIAGDVLVAAAAEASPLPVVATKSYELPSWVGPRTLVFALSCSGDTEETVAAARCALERGAKLVVIAGGGELGRLAAQADAPMVGVPSSIPQPRAALGALAIPPLVILERMGVLPGAGERIAAAIEQLVRRRDELVRPGSAAEEVARRIGRTIPLVHGASGLGAVAAQRWKTQMNENAKSPAFWSAQPELCHNEVVGWGQHGDLTRQALTVVALRCLDEHPQVARRFRIVDELLAEVVADVVEVTGEGQGSLAQFFDLALFGDFVSLHMAAREGIDPGPVPILGELKAALRRR